MAIERNPASAERAVPRASEASVERSDPAARSAAATERSDGASLAECPRRGARPRATASEKDSHDIPAPMLAKAVAAIPDPAKHPGGLIFEPKWDGFLH
ncbi:hypothetical protein GCM10009746_27880 [Microbacterium paludicola]